MSSIEYCERTKWLQQPAGKANSLHRGEPWQGQARGKVTISEEECKGCGLCVESCPPKCLELAHELSAYGVHPAHYTGRGLHRMRHLLLLLSGAGRHHGLSAR